MFFAATYRDDVSPTDGKSNTFGAAWQPQLPWNGLLPLGQPSAAFETLPVLRRCIGARAALAELKQAAELIPNQAILIGTLPLLEAQASSEIENIVTTNDQLFKLQRSGDDADPATKEALRYRYALLEGFKELQQRPLVTRVAETVCGRIKGHEMRVRETPGTTLANPVTGEVIYTPPVGVDVLREKLSDWERFMNNASDLDPLIRMAVGHYQFEAIHPFSDGNGRTGRILNSLFLIQESLLTLPVLYLSRWIIQNKSAYYDRLLGVTRDAAWEPWVLYMLEGVEETARCTTEKIAAIRGLFDATGSTLRERAPKAYSHETLLAIFEQPYCRIQTLVEAGVGTRQTASRHLKEIAAAGVLVEIKSGRDKLFVNRRLMKLLTSDRNDWEPLA